MADEEMFEEENEEGKEDIGSWGGRSGFVRYKYLRYVPYLTIQDVKRIWKPQPPPRALSRSFT